MVILTPYTHLRHSVTTLMNVFLERYIIMNITASVISCHHSVLVLTIYDLRTMNRFIALLQTFEFMRETSRSHETVNDEVDTFLNDPCRELFTHSGKIPDRQTAFSCSLTPVCHQVPLWSICLVWMAKYMCRNRLSDSTVVLLANKKVLVTCHVGMV